MSHPAPRPSDVSRRSVLRQGKKLAYVAPVILLATQATPVFAGASGGDDQGQNNNNQGKGGHH